MPLYEFTCKKCSEEFEELVMGSNHDVECPSCGSGKVQRKLSAFAVGGHRADGSPVSASASSNCTKSSCSGCSCGSKH